MNENLEFLNYIHETSNMGKESAKNILKEIENKECKIKQLLEELHKKYDGFEKESAKLIKKYDAPVKKTGMMGKAMAFMGIKKEVMMDNSDANIADMLIQGITMGNLEITKRIDNYEKVLDKKILNLGKELLNFGEEYLLKLKKYL